jgi:succinate-semialdehyde dehydrogenase/glutarate-semialdehyde dehydrogenase
VALITRIETDDPSRPRYELRHPATLQDIGSFQACNADDAREAVAKARRAQSSWAQLTIKERSEYLHRLRHRIVERMDDIAATVCRETGKPEIEAMAEITASCDSLQYYPKHTERLLREKHGRAHLLWPFNKLVTTVHPKGVIALITPWNFPFSMAANPLAQALVTGNAVILKPSEVTPFTGQLLAELCAEAGFPEHVFQVLPGDGVTGAALLESGVDKVHFTGSVATGRKVGESCGRLLVPCTLELGGKDAAIVCTDADLARAAAGVTYGAMFNSGQACASTERVYVMDSVADEFIKRLVDAVKDLRQNAEGETDLGPMIWDRQLHIVEQQVEDAKKAGATVLCGGERTEGDGLFYQPTVLTDVNHDMTVMTSETFGPVVSVVRVKNEAEAIDLANDSEYGLSSSIWTQDIKRGLELARQIHTGGVAVNEFGGMVYGAAEGSFSGRRTSGIGYVNGELGLKSFCHVQHIVVHRFGPAIEQAWFPYTEKAMDGMKGFIRFFFTKPLGRWMS